MRIATIVSLIGVAGLLSGCGMGHWFHASAPGSTVEFVASNPNSVLLDFAGKPPGELAAANDIATQQCQIFSRRTAVLESLNVRNDGIIRATYLCRNGIESADATTQSRSSQYRRQ